MKLDAGIQSQFFTANYCNLAVVGHKTNISKLKFSNFFIKAVDTVKMQSEHSALFPDLRAVLLFRFSLKVMNEFFGMVVYSDQFLKEKC